MPADDTALTAPNQSVPARNGVSYAYRRFGRPDSGVPPLASDTRTDCPSPIQVKARTWRRRVRSEDVIISSDDLVRRNAAFAATGAFAGLPFPTSDTLQVLGCVDSRVDPSDVLGLALGEGVVMRNIGGRITPAALRSWALLGRLGQGQPPGGHLVILHHTDCGITRLTDYPEQLAAFFEIPAEELESKAVADPYAAVRVDAAIARHTLPPSRLVSGLVYDVATGLIEIVDPAAQE
jgi:carbonic anhydrase